jgi:hypothetical protein
MGRSVTYCSIQGGNGDDHTDISVKNRSSQSLDAYGPEWLGLIIRVYDRASIGLGCLRDYRPLKSMTIL